MASKLLSKSRYLNGLQCPKYLWTLFHEPEKVPEPDAATQHIFDQGHLVGELAKKLFPSGIDVATNDFMGNIRQTERLLQQHSPLFEAGILYGNLYSRVDILNPAAGGEWNVIEVKSSTKVKDVDLHDVSFQKLCCERLGLSIARCFLMYINNSYVKDGDIDVGRLFSVQDITADVEEASSGIQDRINGMFDIITSEKCPDVAIGKQCSNPYDCPLTGCWGFLPEDNVFDLHYGGQRSIDLLSMGIITIEDIPDGFKLSGKQQIQKGCVLTGEPHIHANEIRSFLGTLEYPLHYLDFETFSPCVPMFDGTRPYQKIPFQFSLHVVASKASDPIHFSFLAEGKDDPRTKLLSVLKGALGDSGSVIVYNKAFEDGVLRELGRAFPNYSDWAEGVCGRMVDLMTPFRSFHYYHPAQRGSISIKSVLPALTGKAYEGMGIVDGEDASLAFQNITYIDYVPEETRAKVRKDLEEYCRLDTEGMIWIIDKLREIQ
jgi:hypothetical protein